MLLILVSGSIFRLLVILVWPIVKTREPDPNLTSYIQFQENLKCFAQDY